MHLTVHDVARLFNLSEKTIYRWIGQGKLPAYRVHDQYRFNRAELLGWATSRKINFAPELFRETEEQGPQARLSAALEAGGIFYRVSGHTKDAVLRATVQLMRLPEDVDREFLLSVLLAREAMASTAVGDGIAFPHARTPTVLHVPLPMITLCFLEHPVEYGALDGKPVDVLFTFVTPTVRSHLTLLSLLAFGLRTPSFRAVLEHKALREDIMLAVRDVESRVPAPAASIPAASAP